MHLKFTLQAKIATGIFSDPKAAPAYAHAKSHPVRRALTCPHTNKENVVLSHPHVEALMVVVGGRLRVIRIPHKTFDLLEDVNMQDPFITGAIGDECQTAQMVSMEFDTIFKTFCAI